MLKKSDLKNSSFIIAEVGQNHQGDLDLARKYIRKFAEAGANAIKFQTRDNKYLFAESAYEKVYNSENAFAETYGMHREKLELNPEDLVTLKADCEENGVKFMSTPFDEPSLDLLCDIGADIIKIASFDLGNLPLINRIGKKGIPVVISIGGGKIDQIRESVKVLEGHIEDISILHCVSEYPCEVDRLGLDNIEKLVNEFPDHSIGLSDHFNGIVSGPIAYMKGARVFEKHVTLNRAWRGSDHSFSLERQGFRRFVRDINRVPRMMKQKPENELGKEPVFQKLGKSLVANQNLKKGDQLTLENLSGKIFNEQHIPVRLSCSVLGKKLIKDVSRGDPIQYSLIEEN